MKNSITSEIWSWTKNDLAGYEKPHFFANMIDRLFGLLKLMFGYFLCSNITALYTKITIICAPIFILLTCNIPLLHHTHLSLGIRFLLQQHQRPRSFCSIERVPRFPLDRSLPLRLIHERTEKAVIYDLRVRLLSCDILLSLSLLNLHLVRAYVQQINS